MFAYKFFFLALYPSSEDAEAVSIRKLLQFVIVVLERDHVLVPAGKRAGNLKADELGEPGHVGDLLLLQLHVGVKAPVVESILKRDREPAGRLNQHHIVDRDTVVLSLVAAVIVGRHLLQHRLVRGGVEGLQETLEVLDVGEQLVAVWVQVSDLADVLLALSFATTG